MGHLVLLKAVVSIGILRPAKGAGLWMTKDWDWGLVSLLDGDGFRQIPRLVYVATAPHGDVVGEQLEWDDFENWGKFFRSGGDVEDVVGGFFDFFIAFRGQRDNYAGARFYFFQVGHCFLVAQHGLGIVCDSGGEDDYGKIFVDEGVGAVLHFSGGVAFGVDVGDFLQLERAFEGDGIVDAASEKEKIVGALEAFSEIFAGFVVGEDSFELAGDEGEFLGGGADLLGGHGAANFG